MKALILRFLGRETLDLIEGDLSRIHNRLVKHADRQTRVEAKFKRRADIATVRATTANTIGRRAMTRAQWLANGSQEWSSMN